MDTDLCNLEPIAIEPLAERLELLGFGESVRLARQLVAHPKFCMVQGMQFQFREDDGTWTTHRVGKYGTLPLSCQALYGERFVLRLDDAQTAEILVRMVDEDFVASVGGFAGRLTGVAAAMALLAKWGPV